MSNDLNTKSAIISDYKQMSRMFGNKVTRDYYRSNGKFPEKIIGRLFGSWSNFIKEANGEEDCEGVEKTEIIRHTSKEKVVITSIVNGQPINADVLNTLLNYSKHNDADFFILWGKGVRATDEINQQLYDILAPYLATEIVFEKSVRCVAKDIQISYSAKSPLLGFEKIYKNQTLLIAPSPKQYCKVLSGAQEAVRRDAWTTGTISDIEYNNTTSGIIDANNHTFGAVVVVWNESSRTYRGRNLIFNNGIVVDLGKVYTDEKVYDEEYVSGIVLGDIHFPCENQKALQKSVELIQDLKIKRVVLHDVINYHSINHHEVEKPLTRAISLQQNPGTNVLLDELIMVSGKIDELAKQCPGAEFIVVHSNHDDFLDKYLNVYDWRKDYQNAECAAHCYVSKLRDSKYNPLEELTTAENVVFLPKDSSFQISGYEVGQHGHLGISGTRGNPLAYIKSYTKSVIGHSHSPEIRENTVVVGTLSSYDLGYNKGPTTWAHCNCLIHGNGTHQLIFLD